MNDGTRPPFVAGFLGAATDTAAAWFTKHVTSGDRICVPFTGSGKVIAMMADQVSGLEIDSWDTQIISKAFVEGIFSGDGSSNIDRPRYMRGVMYNERPHQGMPDNCAGFIDYVGNHGTLFDIACIASATARSTFRGRMGEWGDTEMPMLYHRFQTFQEKHKQFVGLPAEFHHTMDDFYQTVPEETYDVLYIDPPKVITNSDAYSRTFDPINRALGGTVGFDRWTWQDFVGKIRKILEGVKWQRVLFMYTTDVRPSWATVRLLLQEYGDISDEETFNHRNRYDYGIEIVRN